MICKQEEVYAESTSALVRSLQSFNRKERYWLLRDAIGMQPISQDYRQRLGHKLGISIPEDAWWAIDYHFDWLHAALVCMNEDNLTDLYRPRLNDGIKAVRGNQEDIDLLIAFENNLILVEAKGETAWSTGQMKSKAERLADLPDVEGLCTYLVLTSPREPRDLYKGEWLASLPERLRNPTGDCHFLPMDALENARGGAPFSRVERCDEQGRTSRDGDHWRIVRGKCGQKPDAVV